MDGNCNVESIIYQAEDTSQTTKETYIGLCDTSSKLAYRNYTSSFCNEWYKNANKLSKNMWNLKDQDIQYNIKWRKIKYAQSYSDFILCKPEMSSLNNRNELTSCCRDSRKFLLKKGHHLPIYRSIPPDALRATPSMYCFQISYISDCNRFSDSCLMITCDEV